MTTPEWQKLSPWAHTRLRAEIFFGSRDAQTQQVLEYHPTLSLVETTWTPAVFTTFRELLDNSLDECITHGHGNRIDVTYDPVEMIFAVTDNGRGIPIEWSEEHQKHAATVLLSEMNSGRNFIDDRGETRGLNGIGAKGVNYCSSWFEVDIVRNKKNFTQQFYEGSQELQVGLATVSDVTSRKSGTKIRCKLSDKVFPNMNLPERFIASRMQEIANCYPKLHLTYNSKRVQPKSIFGDVTPITCGINTPAFKATFSLLPDFVEDGNVAFSLVNAIPLFNGGSHIDAFRRYFPTGLITALERDSKRRKLTPNRNDVLDGLLIYCVMEMEAPSFDSQSKSRLINESAGNQIRQMLADPEFFKDLIKRSSEWIERIYQRCADRSKAKDSRDVSKQAKNNLRQKIEDLEDACGTDRQKCILFLTEGRSAASSLGEARDSTIHASLPMRGKLLNVHGQSHKTILNNEALAKIMNSIGLMPGQKVTRAALRYGKVYLAVDADPDGANIAALIINFFYTCWPELFDANRTPFIYVFDTPLIIATKAKQQRYWYSANQQDFDPDKFKGWEITRAKGLAALTKDNWQYILAHPRAQPIVDDGHLQETLSLLFDSKKSDLRKDWISI